MYSQKQVRLISQSLWKASNWLNKLVFFNHGNLNTKPLIIFMSGSHSRQLYRTWKRWRICAIRRLLNPRPFGLAQASTLSEVKICGLIQRRSTSVTTAHARAWTGGRNWIWISLLTRKLHTRDVTRARRRRSRNQSRINSSLNKSTEPAVRTRGGRS